MHRQFRRPKPLPNINNAQSEMRWSAVPAGAKLTYISALIRRFMRHHLLLHARASSKYILSHFSCYVNIFILISIFYRKIFPIIYSQRHSVLFEELIGNTYIVHSCRVAHARKNRQRFPRLGNDFIFSKIFFQLTQ